MTNKNISENLKNEIIEVLQKFQEGYSKRDITKSDEFLKEIFVDEDIVILGTGIGEWCFGNDGAKELVESDWQYWGDVKLNTDSAVIDECDDFIWLTVDASIKYEFNSDESKYDRFVDFIKGFFDAENPNSSLPKDYKMSHMNWILTQIFQERKAGTRKYLWPLRISGVLKRSNEKLRFTEMQFCLPPATNYPDVRIGFDKLMTDDIGEGKASIADYISKSNNACTEDTMKLFKSFAEDYSNPAVSASELLSRYFSIDESKAAIGSDLVLYQGREEIEKLLTEQRQQYPSMKIEKENIIQRNYGNTKLIASWGILSRRIAASDAMESLKNEITNIINKDISSKEKIFQVQKEITLMQREKAWGEEHNWCFKLEALIQKEDNEWKFNKVQFSFPFYFFLEGMYNIQMFN